MNIIKNNSLEKLSGFEIANKDLLKSILGGVKESPDSKKKDVSSEKTDSASGDTFGS